MELPKKGVSLVGPKRAKTIRRFRPTMVNHHIGRLFVHVSDVDGKTDVQIDNRLLNHILNKNPIRNPNPNLHPPRNGKTTFSSFVAESK